MDSKCLCSSIVLPDQNQLFLRSPRQKIKIGNRKSTSGRVFAIGKDGQDRYYYGGRLVDESMIVLRKRIHEMKMAERNYDAPADWMDWEKKYYTSYDTRICNVVGLLQAQLMNMRPSVALGTIALVTLSVPASTVMITLHLIETVNHILSGIHPFM
ncbi:hypothetical protein BVC80_1039g8 [Macleaya cordata]|uniref:Uncharacterized protein n=1 Tax=Macleaya cordata TaxID=56857 RepID=A0A200QVN3_MACCD|nr:hypothetical protein BVC80_1039g8 [Macleaya cordata]